MKIENQIWKLIGVAALALAMTTLNAAAQSFFNIRPLGLGTVTNTVYYTNTYYVAGVSTTTYVTNNIITPNFNPASSNQTVYYAFGANVPLPGGAPGYGPNNLLSVDPNRTPMVNGWQKIPENVDLTMAVVMCQPLTTMVTSNATFGFDLSDDAVLGSTNLPVQVPVLVNTAGTNEYFIIINRTNFLGACYYRWDSLATTVGLGVYVLTNKFEWRSGNIKF
jgi:hypothetical protein